jgi:hypothetical protein
MIGTRALSKPRAKSPIDLLVVGLGVSPPQVLPHQLKPGIEQIKRESKCPRDSRRGGHAGIVTPQVAPPATSLSRRSV